MSVTPRGAAIFAGIALLALLLPWELSILLFVVWAGVVVVDAWAVRSDPRLHVETSHRLSRGRESKIEIEAAGGNEAATTIEQASVPGVTIAPRRESAPFKAVITGHRRGRHLLPGPGARSRGPLGIGAWHHRSRDETEVEVYPDLVTARRLAMMVRRGKLAEAMRAARGPLGLGTDFESIRDYLPDDEFRQINWAASQRTGRLMSNQYRVEPEREIVCLLDQGRLMSAPVGDASRLDVAVDAVTAIALVAQEVGDRCGLISFDDEVRRDLAPGRRRASELVEVVFDVQATDSESDYELAFRHVRGKRSLVIVLTDLLDEHAARVLTDSIPVLTRRHAVAVATVSDPGLGSLVTDEPRSRLEVSRMAVALELERGRREAVARLKRGGATVIESPPESFPARCVRGYLLAKARARF